jgi:hypothetical protein
MRGKIRIVYWILAVLFLLLTLAEAGFFTDVEGVVVGKKTYRIWGLPTGRRVVIKYKEPMETDPSRLVTRYYRIPVTPFLSSSWSFSFPRPTNTDGLSLSGLADLSSMVDLSGMGDITSHLETLRGSVNLELCPLYLNPSGN